MPANPTPAAGQATRHGRPTRLVHMGLALAVIVQLATSQFMEGPKPGRPENFYFEIHEYAGLAALAFALLFWLLLLVRRHGTDAAALLPWFRARHRAALGRDLARHWHALRSLRLPHYVEHSPLPSAIHGLGLLLMSAMALLGAIWFVADIFGAGRDPAVHLAIEAHELLANLVWAYLIGHAALAVLHHVMGEASLTEMWSTRPTRGGAAEWPDHRPAGRNRQEPAGTGRSVRR